MKVLIVISILFISRTTSADEGSLLVSCNSDDIECLRKSTATFLQHTHQGIPNYGINAIDPLIIPSSDVVFDDGVTYKHKNLNITGLKNQDISDFKMNTAAKSVILTTKVDVNIVGDIELVLTKIPKTFAGSFESYASVLGTATYNYKLKTDDKGVLHFEVGPETITCKVVTSPQLQLSPDLLKELSDDEDVKKISKERKEDARAEAFCSVVKESYKVVIHNMRAAARLLPASAFFKDITNTTKVHETSTTAPES